MKKIYGYLKEYLEEHFDWRLFLSLAIFLGVAIWFNYYFFDEVVNGKIRHRTFERHVIDDFYKEPIYFFINLIYYAVPYLVGALAVGAFGLGFRFLLKPGFWLVLGIFCLVQAGDGFYHWYTVTDNPEIYYYTRKMIQKIVRASFYFVPIAVYFFVRRKHMVSFHGLTLKNFDPKPYLIMMLIMTPLLIWASFDESFLRAYPTMTPGRAAAFWNVPTWLTFGGYEFLYALTFMGLELLFRGFLIFEMEKYLGEKVVIPMVCVYCTLHFGKPMMECISSIFGGFILGVIALRTRSVFGGIWVHIFIALGMDILAFLQEEVWQTGLE